MSHLYPRNLCRIHVIGDTPNTSMLLTFQLPIRRLNPLPQIPYLCYERGSRVSSIPGQLCLRKYTI